MPMEGLIASCHRCADFERSDHVPSHRPRKKQVRSAVAYAVQSEAFFATDCPSGNPSQINGGRSTLCSRYHRVSP